MAPSLRTIVRRALPHSIYRRYRKRRIASLIAGYDAHEVTHEYGGHRLRVHLADPLAQGWYDRDWEEWKIISFLRDRGALAAGATVFDIGAHQAIVALMFARTTGPQGKVVAVEAEPHNARIAAINRDLNDARNLTVIHAAGAATAGSISFAEGLNGVIDERTSAGNVTVPTVTIDGLAHDYGLPDLVFIDVEGYEGQVLQGASSTLANGSTGFAVEVHDTIGDFGYSAAQIADCFRGYELFVAPGDDEPLVSLNGPPPAGRFFLVALPRGSATER